jgi:Trk K+ transport system NAD-binding subunit
VLVLAGTEAQLDRFEQLVRPPHRPDRQEGPVLILGGGRVGQAVADTLEQRGIDYRMVEKRAARKNSNQKVIIGSAADHGVLLEAGIEKAPSVILTTHEDDLNIYLTIYCRRLRPDIQIISRASLNRNVKTMHRAGANLVMSYSSITSTTIVNLLRPGSLIMLSESLSVFSAMVDRRLQERPLLDLRIREQTGCSVIAIKRNGAAMVVNPEPSVVLHQGDELVLVGDFEALARFAEKYPAS